MGEPETVAVIGGGISGLACAFHLQELGVPVALLEASERVGGLVGTTEQDGFLFESGPQSFQGTELLLAFIERLGIEGELIKADPRAPRYVLLRGRLQKIPMSPQAVLTSSLLGFGSRWKILSEPLQATRPPEADESVADFVRRKFGHEILEYLVAPFVSGVYAGDPERLSLRSAFPTLDEWERTYGSILRGALKSRPSKAGAPPSLCSFRRGVGALPRTIAEKLGEAVHTGAHVEGVSRSVGSGYEIRLNRAGTRATLTARAVVLATPAYVAAHLVGGFALSLGAALSGIAYAPVAVVAAAYFRRQIGHPLEGFGLLVPRREKLRTLGTVWNSSLFPGRAPQNKVVLTSFAGGATDPEIVERPSDEIADTIHEELRHVLDISGLPIVSRVWRHSKALPQYNLGHAHILESIAQRSKEIPGLFFSANYFQGPSLGKCVEQAFQAAEAVRDYMKAAS